MSKTDHKNRAGEFRPDIQGLRAIAVLLVLAYHLWPRAVRGGYVGVDVFFVVSGYLITSLLLKDIARTGSVSFARFYARRARRLLPASLVTLMAVLLAVACFAPVVQWRDTAEEVVSSALYVENWRLAVEAVDYLAVDSAPSPVQHFWSLSVEEQFYLGWPLFLVAVELCARRLGARVDLRRVRCAALLAVVATSLAWSVHLGLTGSTTAYFSTFTRIWQLGSGGLLAALGLRSGRFARPALVVGLAAIATSAIVLSDSTSYPGYAALAPTAGALLALHGGGSWDRSHLTRWLGLGPVQFIGDISYSLYLWHWPIITIHAYRTGAPPGPVAALVVLGVTVALAALSKRFVEDPFRRGWRRSRRVVLATAILSTASCVLLAVALHQSARDRRRATLDPQRYPGAAALAGRPVPDVAGAFLPALVDVESDLPSTYQEKCIQNLEGTKVTTCVYGRRSAAVRIALVGDSHAIHWIPAFQEIARHSDVQLVALTKTSCAFSLRPVHHFKLKRAYTECLEWTRNVVAYLERETFDLVLVAHSPRHAAADHSPTALADGIRAALDAVAGAGVRVAVLRATPWFKRMPRDCVAVEAAPYPACSRPRAEVLPDDALAAAARAGRYPMVDLTDLFCPGDLCPPIIGNVFVYRDSHHVTATYMRTLAPVLAERLGLGDSRE